MYTELSDITFSVVMSILEFEVMDGHNYDAIMNWFPTDLNVISLNWDGHFGPQLIVTCRIDDVQQVAALCGKVKDIVEAKVCGYY